MMKGSFTYDLFVIGAGSGGTRAARIAAAYGAKVAIAEADRIGGTCVIRGCVPKKLLVFSSQYARDFIDSQAFGWGELTPIFSWNVLIESIRREVSRLERVYTTNLQKSGVEIFSFRATLEDPHTVRLENNKLLTARYILIATGGYPLKLSNLSAQKYAITSDDVFNLETFPQRLLVVGGGYIAIEFACLFSGLGAKVILLHRGKEILRGFDRDVQMHLRKAMENSNIEVFLEDELIKVDLTSEGIRVETKTGRCLDVDKVLSAVGRAPATDSLRLETAGVKVGSRGEVLVDEQAGTNIPSVFAIGDVTNRVNLTPVAIREGHAFADRIFGGKSEHVRYDLIPKAVFSSPEAAYVGMIEDEIKKKG